MSGRPSPRPEIATFAMGCFWQPDELFRTLKGVLSTEVGYTGGHLERPTYEQVCSGASGHAEAVRVAFDPEATDYETLLQIFWTRHDPTTLNRQGPDIGTQYRSAIFTTTPRQHRQALESLERVQREGLWGDAKVHTQIEPAGPWWPAEAYHQKYLCQRGITHCHLPVAPRGLRRG